MLTAKEALKLTDRANLVGVRALTSKEAQQLRGILKKIDVSARCGYTCTGWVKVKLYKSVLRALVKLGFEIAERDGTRVSSEEYNISWEKKEVEADKEKESE